MIHAWRILKTAMVDTAFSGEGARIYGGRWNSSGTPVVYVSASKAMALLELVVHWIPNPPPSYSAIKVSWPKEESSELKNLPDDWDIYPPSTSTQMIGDRFFADGKYLALAVPSAILKDELNYILNPLHASFKKLAIKPAEIIKIDPRLSK